ncbi:hypothetical protein [Bifidobacterium canis]|uniref:hypothetical protein n=1 Tax=Bifidobacterium canis TaxID=2610880 RepID=UPI0012D85730|nr:hypothetical protein [Bifidobacterium canis]
MSHVRDPQIFSWKIFTATGVAHGDTITAADADDEEKGHVNSSDERGSTHVSMSDHTVRPTRTTMPFNGAT